MRNSTAYVIAGLITLTTVPLYWSMYQRSRGNVSPPQYDQVTVPRTVYERSHDITVDAPAQTYILRQTYPNKYQLAKNQRCYGGAIVEVNGSTYTSVESIDGRRAKCLNGFSDVPIR